jgi:methylmalonyl-CoA/ethylmalonyl-CoA epimerase
MSTTLDRLGLPPIDQIGFVVRDLDAAVARYEPLFGPFTFMDGSVPAVAYRGRVDDCQLRLAFGRSGAVEIELIQWVSGHSPHREFIESGREGMHHLRFRVDDVDAWTERVREAGYSPVWYKRFQPDLVFAYLERADDPLLIELIQLPPG